ncbi:MAG: hypothetical protein E6Q97_19235 [Desulfurellales bacterium]|nr:MAG: hypothetical protein E6Q97_19235 [Desulfurellales bacterium]
MPSSPKPAARKPALKPCPFCGKMPEKVYSRYGYKVWCTTVNCAMPYVSTTLEVWNRRSELPTKRKGKR